MDEQVTHSPLALFPGKPTVTVITVICIINPYLLTPYLSGVRHLRDPSALRFVGMTADAFNP